MTERTEKKTARQSRSREIAGIVLFALALFVLLCLLSYDRGDPSFTHYVAGKIRIRNLGGVAGSYLADSLFRVFGMTAFLFPLLFGIFSMKLLFNKRLAFSLSTVLSCAQTFGCSS